MSFSRDLYTTDLAATLAAARGVTAPFDELSRQYKLLRAAGVFGPDDPRNAFELVVRGLDPMSERMRAVSALSEAHAALSRSVGLFARDLYPSALVEQARRLSETAQNFALPEVLEVFRTPNESFAERILRLSGPEFGLSPDFLESTSALAAFGRASAMADMFAESERLTRDVRLAAGQFSITDMPRFDDLAGYRGFLDAAGLGLSRWPRRRLLSMGEKRRRLKARLQANAAPPHIKKAKTLVHRYELTLREVLDAVMMETYGEDWARERLPLCHCKDLLGKWERRGGEVLDHADYAHYARIMSHPEHFEAIFEAGFDDPAAVFELLTAAGSLRAASHHPNRGFSPDDLKSLRLTWRQIETGLVALTPDFEVEW